GLDNFPKKSVILIEEDLGLAKSIYAQYIASEAAADGKDVCYITARASDEIRDDMKLLRILPVKGFHIEEMHGTSPGPLLDILTLPRNCNLVIVDQFSLYFLNMSLSEFRDAISRLLTAAKTGYVLLLLVDRGVLPERHEALLRAMVDGVIQVTTVVEGDKLKRFLNIPKMQGAKLSEKMLPFTVSDEGFLIDTRERHG
ncbi:MAG: ATPase domain-containing protein, partial [Methanoregula sp.]